MSDLLPTGWAWATPDELAAEAPNALTIGPFGSDLKVPDYRDAGVPLVFVREIRAERFGDERTRFVDQAKATQLARHYVRPGDLLVTKMGNPPGDTAVYPSDRPPAIVTADCIKLTPNRKLTSSRYLRDCFRAEPVRSQLLEQTAGVAQQKLSLERFRTIRIPLPPLNEQRRIVAKLEALQLRSRRAREALDAVPPLLEKLRQSILAAAFRGDLTKDWRAKHKDVEPASELLARIRAERRRKWEESELAWMKARGKTPGDDSWKERYQEPVAVENPELPPLPSGWLWTTFETVAEVDLGRQRAPQYQTGRHSRPYLRVANVKDDRIDFSDVLEMDFDEEDFAHYQLMAGDILLSEGQSPELVGQSAIYEGGVPGLCFQKTLHRFRPYRAGPSPRFAQLLFRHYLRSGVFRSVASLTVNIAHLTLVRLKPLHFPLPPAEEQAEIVRRAQGALGRVALLEETMDSGSEGLHNLERALLAKAFRGELVPQDPNDEPAEMMLARMREVNGSAANSDGHRKTTARQRGRATV